jgi:hypothetical protein
MTNNIDGIVTMSNLPVIAVVVIAGIVIAVVLYVCMKDEKNKSA